MARRPYVVSLSHFVPRQELLPEKRMLLHGFLHRVSGSSVLESQVRRLMPDAHIFGHTHLNCDGTLDGVRYVQWPLGTPREQRAQTRVTSLGMLCLYDGALGGEAPQHWTHWGRHYETFERDLTKSAPPPYVLQFRGLLGGAQPGATHQVREGPYEPVDTPPRAAHARSSAYNANAQQHGPPPSGASIGGSILSSLQNCTANVSWGQEEKLQARAFGL